MVFTQIRPFWLDEWFIIYNLKTRDTAGLFGQLEFMQQFPRVYLVLLKLFTSFFNYSYFSLRAPSFMVGIAVIMFSYKMMRKIFDAQIFARYLFVLVLVSSITFTEYFVQIKQYTMDILLSVFALWQLIEILNIKEGCPVKINRYVFLCISFLIAPFFSYTYPIAVSPVYIVVLLQTIVILRSKGIPSVKRSAVLLKLAPLFLCTLSTALFYKADVKQLIADRGMYSYWNVLMINDNNKLGSFFTNFYLLFSQLGAGIVFETLFGILGVVSFIYGIISGTSSYIKKEHSLEAQLKIYSCLLLVLTFILFLCRKLPMGSPRLNAFTMPSITILIIYFISRISKNLRGDLQRIILPAILYIGVIGNVFSTCLNFFTSAKYKKQMENYVSTEKAIRLAQSKKLPVLVTTGIAYPFYQDFQGPVNDTNALNPCVWVIKTFPAYHMNEPVQIYALKDLATVKESMEQLPPGINSALAGDGISYKIYYRNK